MSQEHCSLPNCPSVAPDSVPLQGNGVEIGVGALNDPDYARVCRALLPSPHVGLAQPQRKEKAWIREVSMIDRHSLPRNARATCYAASTGAIVVLAV